jgi:hypothetical protein
MPADQQPPIQPTLRRLLAIAVAAAVLGLAVTLSFGYADGDPKPHNVRIAASASLAVRSQLDAGLQHAEPGGFVIVNVPSARAAAQSVRSESTAAAFVVPPSGATTIVTAAASSLLQQQAITAVLTGVSDALHRVARPLDVVPLQTGDRAGLSGFVFTLGLLIPSVLGSVGLFLFGMRLRLWWRAAAAALFALIAACAGILALDTILGALTGAGGALIAIGFLGALSFVLFATALQSVVGLTGTGLAALAFIFVGNAISGGSVPIAFLPDGFRQIAPWLPNAAIVMWCAGRRLLPRSAPRPPAAGPRPVAVRGLGRPSGHGSPPPLRATTEARSRARDLRHPRHRASHPPVRSQTCLSGAGCRRRARPGRAWVCARMHRPRRRPIGPDQPERKRVQPSQPAPQPVGTLVSVNVGMPKDVSWQGRTVFTGVFKDPVPGPSDRRRGVRGDAASRQLLPRRDPDERPADSRPARLPPPPGLLLSGARGGRGASGRRHRQAVLGARADDRG